MALSIQWKDMGELLMRTFKRLMFALVLCLAVLSCGAAMADVDITPVPAERIEYVTRLGLELTAQKQDGQIQFKIDPEKTDWPSVLTWSLAGEGFLDIEADVVLPTDENVKSYMWLYDLGGNPTEAQIRQAIAQAQAEAETWGGSAYCTRTGEGDAKPSCFVIYAEYNENEKLIALRENTNYITICYFDAAKNLLYAETIAASTASASSTRQIPNVEKLKISKDNVTPNVIGLKGYTVTLNDGDLVYVADSQAVESYSLETCIKTPEGTDRVVRYKDGFNIDAGNPMIPNEQGNITFIHYYKPENMTVVDYSYAFLDTNGNILRGSGQLCITIVDESANRLALHFLDDDNWNPIPQSRFRNDIIGGSGLVQATYKDALVHISADKQGTFSEVDARSLPDAQKSYQVQAPQNAKAYRIANLGGGNAFGAGEAQSYQGYLKGELSKSTLHAVQGEQWVVVYSENVFGLFATSENGSKLYSVGAETEKGRATFFAVEWFSDAEGKNSLGVEWFGENAEALTLKAKTFKVSSPDQITSQLDGAAVVCSQDGLTLYAEYRAQSGENAYVIDLTLLGEDGNAVEDFSHYTRDGTLEFFIPYPKGLSVASDYTYNVTHYLSEDLTSSEPALQMSCEVGGIRFRLSSLSPVELSWQSNETPPEPTVVPQPTVPPETTLPPKTGDTAPIALWLTLCLITLSAMAAILHHRRKA